MPDTAVKTVEIDGTPYEVRVNGRGEFYATVDTYDVKADTLKGLEAKLRAKRRTKRLSIPITLVKVPRWSSERHKGLQIEHGTITGVHAGNNRILYKPGDGGKATTLDSFDGSICRRLSDPQVAEIRTAWDVHIAAEEAWDGLLKSVTTSGRTLIKEALTPAGAQPPTDEELEVEE